MPLKIRHTVPIPSSPRDAERLQAELALEVNIGQKHGLLSGVIVKRKSDCLRAIAVSVSSSNWSVVERQVAEGPPPSGSTWGDAEGFRQAPLMLEALSKLHHTPDVVFVAGAGRAHPKKFGVACHVGLALERPTIGVDVLWPNGCTKSKVMLARGQHKRGYKFGLQHELTKEVVGHELWTQDRQDPLYISPGHWMDLDTASNWVLRASLVFRLPEPLRRAEETS